MRKHIVCWLVAGLCLLAPAGLHAQAPMIQPAPITGPLSHPGYDEGGWFFGTDFLYLQKVLSPYNGDAPQSILSVGYMNAESTVFQLSWWDQWFSPNPSPDERMQIIDFSTRIKTFDNGCYRNYTIFGPRAILTSEDFNVAEGTYSVHNNMIGAYVGSMNEWYLGTNPLGAFSYTLDGDVGAYANFVRQSAGNAFGTNYVNQFTLSGSLQAKTGFIWYAWEGLTIHFGLDILSIINMQTATQTGNNTFNAVHLTPRMPVWIGFYFGFGFVF